MCVPWQLGLLGLKFSAKSCKTWPWGGSLAPKPYAGNILSLEKEKYCILNHSIPITMPYRVKCTMQYQNTLHHVLILYNKHN